ncbi:HdeA/HdeB family chaperone [Bradyrhizobium sp. SYSU BS000235]|uniref:HdeA/HdeB family chaperone n=1 Tax=Bradyrhizobium sp. SYSU BS000235 TaxID=3411332 RepID=UPI003C746454
MKLLLASVALAIAAATPSQAQVELKTYANRDGYIDVQTLTCAQLANTYQEDADHLTAWYSGWYNGLAKKHMMNVERAKDLEHQIIEYCQANKDKKIIQAIDVVFKEHRAQKGIKTKKSEK